MSSEVLCSSLDLYVPSPLKAIGEGWVTEATGARVVCITAAVPRHVRDSYSY